MKNSVDAVAFYKAMTALMEVPSKSSIEVLREIRAEFTGDRCVLSATDLDTWMSVTITAVGDSFDLVFRNSANIQKVCRHYDGSRTSISGRRKDIARPAVMMVGWMLKRRFLSVFPRWNSSRSLVLRIYRSAWQITGSCSRMNTFACLRNVS